jgi:nucleoside-diphosphate-sugar epimerase
MIILGCGYIGTALAQSALAAGESVSALTRSQARAELLRALGLNPVVAADIAADAWHGALPPAGESIVFCVSPSQAGEDGYRHSFVEGAKSVQRWLEESVAAGNEPARELVFTSSTSVYPQTDGGWVDETSPVDTAQLGPAGRMLRETEDFLLALAPRLVHRVWILRLAGIYGPHRHHLLDALRAGVAIFPGDGGNWVNLVHRDDAVGAIRSCLAALTVVPGGIFNVADDEPVRKRELVEWLAKRVGSEVAEIKFNAEASGRSGHRRNATGETPSRRISSVRLKRELGWQCAWPSFREGYGQILAKSGF